MSISCTFIAQPMRITISSCAAAMFSRLASNLSAQRCVPVSVETCWAFTRRPAANRRTLPLENITHAKLFADPPRMHRLPPVSEGGSACYHQHARHARQIGGKVVRDAIHQVVV